MSNRAHQWQSPRQTQTAGQPVAGVPAQAGSTLPLALGVASLIALVLAGLVSALAWPPAGWLVVLAALIPAALAVATVLAAMVQREAKARVVSFVLAGVVALVALGAIVVVAVLAATS